MCVCVWGGGGYIHVSVTGGWMIKYTAMHSQMDSMCKRKGREKEGGRREREREREGEKEDEVSRPGGGGEGSGVQGRAHYYGGGLSEDAG